MFWESFLYFLLQGKAYNPITSESSSYSKISFHTIYFYDDRSENT